MAYSIEQVYTINEIKDKIVPIAKKYGVARMSLFGSYARGEADEKSDVDIFITLGKLTGLDYFGFILDMEDELKRHVDVVTAGARNAELLAEIKRDEVLLYEG